MSKIIQIKDENDLSYITRNRIEFGLKEFYYLMNFIGGKL